MTPTVHAGYFGPPERRRMGWLHPPSTEGRRRSTGVVICPPHGYEALCAHRSLRHVAAAAALAGYPSLRFDYDGTGDSVGLVDDPARWPAWRTSIGDAVRALRTSAQVERVVLLGVGLGATLAATVAADDPGIAGAIAIAPIVNGKGWLREMQALQRVMARAAPPAGFELPDGSEEIVGLFLSAETKEAIARVDLTAITWEGARPWLVIDRTDRAPSTTWIAALERQGAPVEHAMLPGYVEMMQDPHEADVPTAIIARVVRWLEATYAEAAEHASSEFAGSAFALSADPARVTSDVEECPVQFGTHGALFGVLAKPVAVVPTRALILVNAGANHHIGNGRMYVQMARRLASEGWVVLRVDVSGIGESAPHPGCPENEVYTAKAVDDLRDAVHFLRHTRGLAQVQGAGLCSGGYNVFRAAAAGVPLDGIVVVNPLTFRWHEEMSLKYPAYVMAQSAAQYRDSIRHWSKWVKLLRGGVDLRHAGEVIADRLRDRGGRLVRDTRRAIGVPVADDLGTELLGIVERGVPVRFVFSEGDPGEALLRNDAGRAFTQLHDTGRVRLAHLPGCDHSLSAGWMREMLWQALRHTLNA
ncbi:serine aminopeptidase domain-containing protein [Gemmatimonas sp.]|jgi:pimeloyl-ACP methyl ester carboxylesterase|uniref:serine aminopeptidase domain-containing protein n=1 Tax=Gemmatimonas sp. TaxID=1962908 RepID=UPI0031BC1B3A|nr:hypothetical protein [Gemmatimonas sp.]